MQSGNIGILPGFVFGIVFRVIPLGLFTFSVQPSSSQSVLVDHVFFPEGQSGLSDTSGKIMDDLLFWAPEPENLRINISIERDQTEEEKYGKDLTRARLESIIQYFIEKQLSRHILEIRITDANAPVTAKRPVSSAKHKVTIVLRESLADNTGSTGLAKAIPADCTDTILVNDHSMIRISGDSFLPEKIPDFTFRVSEYTTTGEFMDHNISTACTQGRYIGFLNVIHLAVLPKAANRDAPAMLKKPMVFMIKLNRDSSDIRNYRVFCQAKKGQNHVSWEPSPVIPSLKRYQGSLYLYFRITSTGLTGIGKLITANRCLSIRTPGFQQMKMTLVSPENRQVIYCNLLPDHVNRIQIPDDQDFFIFIECLDKKGNLLTWRNRIGREQKSLLLERKDFAEMKVTSSIFTKPVAD